MTRATRAWLVDLDGVLLSDDRAVKGAPEFVERLTASRSDFVVLTNNSMYTPEELAMRLARAGMVVPPDRLWTSALATARFVHAQRPGGAVYAIGRPALHEALAACGCRVDRVHPDFVVVGETQSYAFDDLTRAVRLVDGGAKLLATNPEPTGPSPGGPLPGCGALVALVERATSAHAYVIGKPNPLMLTEAIATMGATCATTTIVGDRMETDIRAGTEAGLATVLVLSGVATVADLDRFAFRPGRVVDSVADLLDDV